jgi:hypothetical protein
MQRNTFGHLGILLASHPVRIPNWVFKNIDFLLYDRNENK